MGFLQNQNPEMSILNPDHQSKAKENNIEVLYQQNLLFLSKVEKHYEMMFLKNQIQQNSRNARNRSSNVKERKS
jgi:hypothetical protein